MFEHRRGTGDEGHARQEAAVAERTGGAAAPVLEPCRLADGRTVAFRRATALDADALRRFYLGLSPRTLLLRFMTPTPRLPESSIAYLCDVRHTDREVVLATLGSEIVGEGRFHRLDGAREAEVALVVADAWQGLGIGRALSARLAGMAALRGISAFTGTMLSDNAAARGLLGSMVPGASRRVVSGELEFRSPLAGVSTERPTR
ncbi:MAG TPA: GNAT family N-acetyltransferase [Actinomycetota bacterium]|nr:GNAT family N-acetyltransferase [Actinomycetota bacterium]